MGAAASVPTQLDAAGVLALLGCEACEAADLCAGDEDDSEENGMCSREAAYAACCGAVGGCGARTAVRSSLDAVLGAALVRAGCVASTASALSAAGDELGAAQRALLAYSPCRGACDLVVGDRCYALLGTFFWPAIVTAVKRGDDDAMDGLPARVLLDLETVHARAFFGACGSSRVSEEEVAAAAATTTLPTLPTWMTVVSDLDASEFVRPADESRDAWVAHTSTKTRIDSLYFDEADRAVALLASGAVETMPEASECVKSWFRDRYNLGSNAMGADFWTFLLAREASLFRLGVLAERLLEVLERERLTETLGAVTRDLERALLLSTGGGDGESVRNDVVAPAGLADWLRARVHSDPRLSGLTPLSDETLDGVGTHCLIMLGEVFARSARSMDAPNVSRASSNILES